MIETASSGIMYMYIYIFLLHVLYINGKVNGKIEIFVFVVKCQHAIVVNFHM